MTLKLSFASAAACVTLTSFAQNPPPPRETTPNEVNAVPPIRPVPPARKHPVVKGETQFPAIEAPALPITAEKQQRLNELLRKYRADEVSPEQYHAERAKILAEP